MVEFEDIAKELSSVDDSGLNRVSKLAHNQLRLEKRVADLDAELKQAKRDLREISDDQLPAAMLEFNIREFKLEDGSQITVKHFYSASIPKEKQEEAFDWLNTHGYGDLIKNQVSVNFVRGQEEKAQGLVQELEDRNLPTSNKKWVEPMTLKAFAKELVEAGKSLPFDLFSLYIGEQAKITKPKG